jgi:uroporphyrinogen-III synthase
MTRPRVLVVRSGARPFPSGEGGATLEVIERVSHRIEPVAPPERALTEPVSLVIFTSQASVERVGGDPRLSEIAIAARAARVAAVGPATAEALRVRGIEPALTAAGSGEALLAHLPARMEGWRVVLPCGEDSAQELPEGLRRRGARVDRVVVYRKVRLARDGELETEIVERPFTAFCATSPSAAAWLFEDLPEAATLRLRGTPAVVLGPSTCRDLEARGVDRIAMTARPRFSAALLLLKELASAPGGA